MANQTKMATLLLQSIWAEGVFDCIARFAAKRPVGILLALYAFGTDRLIAWHTLPFGLMGMVDEPAHLATALIVLGAISRYRGRPPMPKFGWSLLVCSVFIDVDHLPAEFGSYVLTDGTPRPFTHALWTVIVLMLAWSVARCLTIRSARHRPATAELLLAGASWGLSAHFLRDIATAQMSLWWPITDMPVQVPYWWYMAALLVIVALPLRRRGKEVGAQSRADNAVVRSGHEGDTYFDGLA